MEYIDYIEPSSFSLVENENGDKLEFTFSDKIPYTSLPFMGLDLSIPFLNTRMIKGVQYVKITRDDITRVYEPSFTNYKITGLLSVNGDNFTFTYDGDKLKTVTEKRGSDNYQYDLTYDNEGKLFEVNTFLNEGIISQKQLMYSENDILIGFNELHENHMFIFNNLDVINFTSKEGNFTITYL